MIVFRRINFGLSLKRISQARKMQVRQMSVIPLDIHDENVFFEVKDKCGIITFNRPRSLNAINAVMAEAMNEHLKKWENEVSMIIIKGEGKAFTAGGDIRECVEKGPTDCEDSKRFFMIDYMNDYLIANYKRPIVSLMNGITMGSGVGIAVNSRFRVATEKTLMAMPETAIGLFPDVGSSFFLPRLPGEIGMFLALTGYRLMGTDCLAAGLATHYCKSENLPSLFEDLVLTKGNVDEIIAAFKRANKDFSMPTFSLNKELPVIDRIFALPTVEEIFKALEEEGSDFSKKTLKTLKNMSPFSLKVTHKEMKLGRTMSLKECLQMEYRLCHNALEARESNDFYEGVRALIIEKEGRPKWNPSKLEDVSMNIVNNYFRPLAHGKELVL